MFDKFGHNDAQYCVNFFVCRQKRQSMLIEASLYISLYITVSNSSKIGERASCAMMSARRHKIGRF